MSSGTEKDFSARWFTILAPENGQMHRLIESFKRQENKLVHRALAKEFWPRESGLQNVGKILQILLQTFYSESGRPPLTMVNIAAATGSTSYTSLALSKKKKKKT
jgi:hypothetical protein